MSRPRLLDLFCGAGGAAKGYQRAGFYVVGVDVNPQPHYCGDEFWQADALEVLRSWDVGGTFDAVHASPPCKAHTVLWALAKKDWPDLLTPTRERLSSLSVPWVIENVPGAPMRDYITLCGTSFGLGAEGWELWRHRQFEGRNFEWPLFLPQCAHGQRGLVAGVYGGGGYVAPAKRKHGKKTTAAQRREVMGIDWMNRHEVAQAIPPAYTEWIGAHLLATVQGRVG